MADTLYETIGGAQRINRAVDLFYAKVLADDSLRSFFEGVDVTGLHARQSMFISTMLDHFRAALSEIQVAPDRIVEIMTRLESTRNTVLGRSG